MIRILDNKEILSINAGEVINSFYTIVKELVENSLDAQATNIEIRINKSTIMIDDNGQGMDYYDLLNCAKCYATSKFQSIDAINNLGFRGKALYFIDNLCHMTICTKPDRQALGYKCHKNTIEPYVMNKGTNIVVKDILQYGQQKFLQPLSKDKSIIIDMIEAYGLIYGKSVEFKLYINNRFIPINNKIPVGYEVISFSYVENTHYNIACKLILTNEKYQTIINVNKRFVINSKFFQSIKHLMELYFGKRVFFLYLNINCNPDRINCNIEPQKTTVMFEDHDLWDKILLAIQKHIKSRGHRIKPQIHSTNDLKLKEKNTKFLYIKNNKYIFLTSDHEIICIDQHAAHERIIAEKLKLEPIQKQLLLQPIIINNISKSMNIDKLNQLFDFTISNGKLVVFSIPSIMNESDVIYFLNNWKNEDPITFLLHHIHEHGCKTSIKAGNPLSPYEAVKLYETLLVTHHGHICNHGRPTFFTMNENFLDKMFHRK
jgi:DNA mismatch repair protein MutL